MILILFKKLKFITWMLQKPLHFLYINSLDEIGIQIYRSTL